MQGQDALAAAAGQSLQQLTEADPGDVALESHLFRPLSARGVAIVREARVSSAVGPVSRWPSGTDQGPQVLQVLGGVQVVEDLRAIDPDRQEGVRQGPQVPE